MGNRNDVLFLFLVREGIDYIYGDPHECRWQLRDWMMREGEDPEQMVSFMQGIDELGHEAKQVVYLILNTPDELIRVILSDSKATKRAFKRYVKEYFGWPWHSVHSAFREIQKIF